MGGILGSLGIDPFYLFVIVFILQLVIIVLLYYKLRRNWSGISVNRNDSLYVTSFCDCH